MDYFVTLLAQHGYSILCAAVFLETSGFPVPAAIALLFAGGASARPPFTFTHPWPHWCRHRESIALAASALD